MSDLTISKQYNFFFKDFELSSNCFLAPINTGLAKVGNPTSNLISFHNKRAGNLIGISYVGNIATSINTVTNSNTLYISRNMLLYERLAETIKNKGSLAGAQIACMRSEFEPIRKWKNRNLDTYIKYACNDVKSASKKSIRAIINEFIEGSVKLINCGFDVIQIHAAHGYFLSNLLSRLTNTRNDEYGKKTQVIKEIVEGIKSKTASKFLLDIRISFYEITLSENSIESRKEIIHELIENGIDIISFSNGLYNVNKQLIYPTSKMGESILLNEGLYFANLYPKNLINIAGNIRDIKTLNTTHPLPNLTYSIGRPLIADELFISKNLNEEPSKINVCTYSNKCHYYSLKKDFISCGVNSNVF